MTNKQTILVTGASGFIGGWIAEILHLSHSADVRAGIRNWSSGARLARFPIEIVLCDVMDKQSISRAMLGANCVVHSISGSSEAITQGTENVLEVAHAQKIGRLVHLSSTEVYGKVRGEINETSPFKSMRNEYADAKIKAEQLCWQYYRSGLPITVVRPSIVYGPFSASWTIALAQRLQSGNWGILKGYGEGICNLVYVADLVSGILLAARHEHAVGEAFNMVGPESMTWNQYFKKFNAALGLPELKVIDPADAKLRAAVTDPVRSLGKFVLKHFSAPLRTMSQRNRLARELLQYADRTLKTNPRTGDLSLYNREAVYLTTKARDILGYRPNFDVSRGLDLSVEWLRHAGLVEQLI